MARKGTSGPTLCRVRARKFFERRPRPPVGGLQQGSCTPSRSHSGHMLDDETRSTFNRLHAVPVLLVAVLQRGLRAGCRNVPCTAGPKFAAAYVVDVPGDLLHE